MEQTPAEIRAKAVMDLFPVAQVQWTADGAVQIGIGGEAGVVLVITGEVLELRLPTTNWSQGSHSPIQTSWLWKRRLWRTLKRDEVKGLIEAAIRKRQAEFIPCRYCHRSTPPERRHGRVCHACAESCLGEVH